MSRKACCPDAGEDRAMVQFYKELYLRGWSLASFARRFKYPSPSVKLVARDHVVPRVEPTSGAYLAIYEDLLTVLELPVIRGFGVVQHEFIDHAMAPHEGSIAPYHIMT